MKVKIWHIDGYKGFDDCDGVSDYNIHFDVAMDSRFSEKDVLEIFFNRWKHYRSVSLSVTEKKEINI